MGGRSSRASRSRVSNLAKRSRQQAQPIQPTQPIQPQRRAPMLQGAEVNPPNTVRATFEGGQFGHYTPGPQYATGANGTVRRFIERAGDVRQPGARRPEALGVKTFIDESELQIQRGVAIAVRGDPVLRRLIVPVVPLRRAVVMPWLRTLTVAALRDAEGPYLSDLWHQTRAALDALMLAGHGYFDLKRGNLLLDGDRLVIADIAGVYVAETGPVLRVNSYAHPGHSGFAVVDDANVVGLMRLCGDWAMLQLAWDLLGVDSAATIGAKRVYALQYGTAATMKLHHVLLMVTLTQDRARAVCTARGADPAMLVEPTLWARTADLMVAQLEQMRGRKKSTWDAQRRCCVAYVDHFPERTHAAARLRELTAPSGDGPQPAGPEAGPAEAGPAV